MEKKIKDGGFAFPCGIAADSMGGLNFSGSYPNTGGMSLRDYFAGQVIGNTTLATYTDSGSWSENTVAKNAYLIADAMLKARETSKEGA